MSSYKLTYFDLDGRAKTIRLAFTVAGIPFEDFRVKGDDWPALKQKVFTGQLPILEVDGKVLSESTAIARFVAKKGGLLGSNDFEQAKIESVADALEVFLNILGKYKYAEGDLKETLGKDIKEKSLPGIIRLLEAHLGDKEYFVLDKLTLAEIHFLSVFGFVNDLIGQDWQTTSPKLKALYERVGQHKLIASYVAKK